MECLKGLEGLKGLKDFEGFEGLEPLECSKRSNMISHNIRCIDIFYLSRAHGVFGVTRI